MFIEQTYQQSSALLNNKTSARSRSRQVDKTDEVANKKNILNKRKDEILAFSNELKKYELSYSILASQKPKKKDEREQTLAIASFISSNPAIKETFLDSKSLPENTILEHFDVPKPFLRKNKFYLIAISLLLIGPYSEMKRYFLEGML